jgi:RNA polymerase sigma-70 factor (ECF subfamily)
MAGAAMGADRPLTVPGHDRFAALYARYRIPLWRYLLKLGAGSALADDLTQDAFVRWWNSRAASWPEDERIRAYLFTIATRLLIDRHRRHRREVAWDDQPEEEFVAEQEPPALIGGAAWQALTPRERQLLWLAYAEEFSHEEIAAICGLATGSVKVLLHRARGRIAAFLSRGDSNE